MNTNLILAQRSEETYNEAVKLLQDTGRCAILRPTGFGKTVIMCRISRLYKKILYVYPSEIVKEHAKKIIESLKAKDKIHNKITFCTYAYLGKLHDDAFTFVDGLISDGYDLIIFDEIHHMGAKLVKSTLEVLKHIPSTMHMLGGTATPDRMDGYDVVGSYFGNSLVSFYGVDNLIEDKLIPKPYYVYSTYGAKWAIDRFDKTQDKYKQLSVDIRDKKMQIAKVLNAPDIISETINFVYDGSKPNYMRFLVFFSTKSILQLRTPEVTRWFNEAFPNYKVNEPVIIYSEALERKNISKLAQLKTEDSTIDLIFSINMLNEGYHAGNITGCVLLRPTQSQIVYTQQVGRSLQVGMENRPIIFDFVDNLSTHALYGLGIVEPKDDAEEVFEAEVEKLNEINAEHIEIDNRIGKVNEILSKLEDTMVTGSLEAEVLKYRKQYCASAADIAKSLDIPLYQVMRVLNKYRNELSEIGLQLQDLDRYETYMTGVRKEVDEFDEYKAKVEAEG